MRITCTVNMESEHVFLSVIYISHKNRPLQLQSLYHSLTDFNSTDIIQKLTVPE